MLSGTAKDRRASMAQMIQVQLEQQASLLAVEVAVTRWQDHSHTPLHRKQHTTWISMEHSLNQS